jgi:hypothetical protein
VPFKMIPIVRYVCGLVIAFSLGAGGVSVHFQREFTAIQKRIAEIETRITRLQSEVDRANSWMATLETDCAKLRAPFYNAQYVPPSMESAVESTAK